MVGGGRAGVEASKLGGSLHAAAAAAIVATQRRTEGETEVEGVMLLLEIALNQIFPPLYVPLSA